MDTLHKILNYRECLWLNAFQFNSETSRRILLKIYFYSKWFLNEGNSIAVVKKIWVHADFHMSLKLISIYVAEIVGCPKLNFFTRTLSICININSMLEIIINVIIIFVIIINVIIFVIIISDHQSRLQKIWDIVMITIIIMTIIIFLWWSSL